MGKLVTFYQFYNDKSRIFNLRSTLKRELITLDSDWLPASNFGSLPRAMSYAVDRHVSWNWFHLAAAATNLLRWFGEKWYKLLHRAQINVWIRPFFCAQWTSIKDRLVLKCRKTLLSTKHRFCETKRTTKHSAWHFILKSLNVPTLSQKGRIYIHE